MDNDTIITKKVQQQIQKYSHRISKGFSRPKKRFIAQMLFGIQASRDIKLSNVSRSLNEEIKLIQTEKRLSRHLSSKDITESLHTCLVKEGASKIQADTVLALDLSDINKPFAKKMEYLSHVWNGSEGQPGHGYWICEIIGASVKEESVIPLYSSLYSHEAKGFESENDEILKAIETVNAYAKGRGIWTMDRGADRKILVAELGKMNLRFVIRSKGNRKVKDFKGTFRSIQDILKEIDYTERYKVAIDKEGYTEAIEVSLGVKEDLKIADVPVRLVAIKGFGQEVMLLITNVDKDSRDILEIYLTRWKCEESFRFLKQEYHAEDIRVRSYMSLRNSIILLHAVFYFLSTYLGRRLRLNILLHKILERAKRFFQIPAFKHYAVADGIYRLLFHARWKDETEENSPPADSQLAFSFLLD